MALRSRVSIKSEDPERVWYQVQLTNPVGGLPQPIKFFESRSDAIIQVPADFNICIQRFDIPTVAIPIFFFPDPSVYYVTLTYLGVPYQVQVQYTQSGINLNYQVHSVYNFLQSINAALSSAFTAFKAANPGSPVPSAPFMIFNNATKIFSLIADETYETQDVGIWFNSSLYNKFGSFNTYFQGDERPDKLDERILVLNYGNNAYGPAPSTLLEMPQDFANPGSLISLERLLITTSMLPVVRQLVSTSSNQSTSGNQILGVLQDFVPVSGDAFNSPASTQRLQYYANPYKLYQLIGHSPINSIDLNIVWIDEYKVERPVYLLGGETCDITVLFLKKGLSN